MIIGTSGEIKPGETRAGLAPDGTGTLVKENNRLLIGKGTGVKVGFQDEDYENAGGIIKENAYEVCKEVDAYVRVKDPIEEEWGLFPLLESNIYITYHHAAANKPLTEKLMEHGVTGIAYGCIEDGKGNTPLLEPMSIIAGNLAVEYAARYLQMPEGGKGKSLMSIPGIKPAKVVIMGGGAVGRTSAEKAAGLGADVTLFDNDHDKITELERYLPKNVRVLYPNRSYLREELREADVLIGAVYVKGAKAPKVVDKGLIKLMKEGSLLLDISIDQGGCFEDSRPTTHLEPTYELDGKIHCNITNMPAAVGRDSTIALTNRTLPYISRLASKGLWQMVQEDPGFAKGVITYKGKLTNKAVADSLRMKYTPLEEVLEPDVRAY